MNFRPLIFLATVMTIGLIALSFQTPTEVTGLAPCPGCKVIPKPSTPDHSLLLLALALLVSLMGAHSLRHYSEHKHTKLAVAGVFLATFGALAIVFSLRLTSPNTAATIIAQQGASIFAAVGILALFTLAAFELGRFYETKKEYPSTLAEDEWDTEKPAQ